MLLIFMTQKAGYLLRNQGMSGIRLSKSSVQMLDIVALLLRMRRVNSALTLIFRKKSNLINGKSSLGDGWSNVPSPGSTIPDVSAKIMRFPSLLLRLWLKSPISIPYSSAYEYSFLEVLCRRRHDTYDNLAFEFNVSRRTIRRDIAILMCSYPIETSRGYGGGVRVADGYYLHRRTLNKKQVALLIRLRVQLDGDDLNTLNSILRLFAP